METKTFSDVSKYGVRYESDEPIVPSDDTKTNGMEETKTKTEGNDLVESEVPTSTPTDTAEESKDSANADQGSETTGDGDDDLSEYLEKFSESDLGELPEDINEEDVIALVKTLSSGGEEVTEEERQSNNEKLVELVKAILEERKLLKDKVMSVKDGQSTLVSDGLSILELTKQKQKQNKELESELNGIKGNPLLSSLIAKTREGADLTEDLIDYVSEKKGVNIRELINGSKVDVNSMSSGDRDSVSTRNASGNSGITSSGVRFEED